MKPTEDFFSTINYLSIETNSSCNLDCKYCNRRDLEASGFRKPRNLTPEELTTILDQISCCPINTIKIEGLSEPMLHPQFDLLAKKVRQYFPEAFIIISTNCQYDLQETPFFKTLPHIDMVYLSIDGTEKLYEDIRKGASWKRLLKTLGDMKDAVSPGERNKKLYINFTATEENYSELPKMYRLVEQFGLASVRINLAQHWNENGKSPHSFSDEMLDYMKKYADDLKGVGEWQFKDCFWPFNGLMIDVSGDLRQCLLNTGSRPFGNIFHSNIKDLYNNSLYLREIRNGLNKNEPSLHCKNCSYAYLSLFLSRVFSNNLSGGTARKKINPSEKPKAFHDYSQKKPISPGGSGVLTFLVKKGERHCVRKMTSIDSAKKLMSQYQWLKNNQGHSEIPVLAGNRKDDFCFYFDMEYNPQSLRFFDVIHERGEKFAGDILHRLLQFMRKNFYRHARSVTSLDDLYRYFEEKIENKVRYSASLIKDLREILNYPEIFINDRSYENFPAIISRIRSNRHVMTRLSRFRHGEIHGDLTVDNIMIIDSDYLILDPNDENYLSDPMVDYAKLYQSLHSGYEFLCNNSEAIVEDRHIRFTQHSSREYTYLFNYLIEILSEEYDKKQLQMILFHEAVHFARMLPYKARLSPHNFMSFYATMVKLFNDFYREMESVG